MPICVYCFDLLELNGRDLRELALVQRRAKLKSLLARAKCSLIRFSESFPRRRRLAGRMRPPRSRGHRRKAERFALSIRHAQRVGQGENGGVEGHEPVPREAIREDIGVLLGGR